MSDVENTEECKTEPMTLDEAIEHAESCVNDTPCGLAHKQLADWLKELKEYKSGKFGNGFAIHSALKEIHDRVNSLDEDCGVDPIDILDIAREALSKQPRNCDVGSKDEQHDRFKEFCARYFLDCEVDMECSGCPLVNGKSDCEFAWGQMLYTEGTGDGK